MSWEGEGGVRGVGGGRQNRMEPLLAPPQIRGFLQWRVSPSELYFLSGVLPVYHFTFPQRLVHLRSFGRTLLTQ